VPFHLVPAWQAASLRTKRVNNLGSVFEFSVKLAAMLDGVIKHAFPTQPQKQNGREEEGGQQQKRCSPASYDISFKGSICHFCLSRRER
jgi:hypothetical protein